MINTLRQRTRGLAVPESGLNVRVDKDNILAVRNSLRDRVAEFENKARATLGHSRIPTIADDPVSKEATAGWNHRLFDGADSHLARMQAYVRALNELCEKLTATAAEYGITEETNTALLKPGG